MCLFHKRHFVLMLACLMWVMCKLLNVTKFTYYFFRFQFIVLKTAQLLFMQRAVSGIWPRTSKCQASYAASLTSDAVCAVANEWERFMSQTLGCTVQSRNFHVNSKSIYSKIFICHSEQYKNDTVGTFEELMAVTP